MSRVDDLAANLAAVRARVPDDVTLVAVSKTWPASDVLLLRGLGVRDFGESYDQEAAAKAGALAQAGADVRWHFVGHLQRNKARSVASYAHAVHSLDSGPVVAALGAAAARAGRVVHGFVQVRYDDDPGRSGCPPDEAPRLADLVARQPGLALAGLMTVAPPGVPPRPVFASLRGLRDAIARDHPEATGLSMGMTGDLADALAEGATHVRIGTALFGGRSAPVG